MTRDLSSKHATLQVLKNLINAADERDVKVIAVDDLRNAVDTIEREERT